MNEECICKCFESDAVLISALNKGFEQSFNVSELAVDYLANAFHF